MLQNALVNCFTCLLSFSVNDIRYMMSSSRGFTSRTAAVAWGIGHTKASVEACAEACRAHKANPSGSASLIFQAHPRCHLQVCVRGRHALILFSVMR